MITPDMVNGLLEKVDVDEGLKTLIKQMTLIYDPDGPYNQPKQILKEFGIDSIDQFTDYVARVPAMITLIALAGLPEAKANGLSPQECIAAGWIDGYCAGLLVGKVSA